MMELWLYVDLVHSEVYKIYSHHPIPIAESLKSFNSEEVKRDVVSYKTHCVPIQNLHFAGKQSELFFPVKP